jgi:CRISPR/Cas system-associated exonuclease Cas4 (RecB family)
MDADGIKALVVEAITNHSASTERGAQQRAGLIGMSDLGVCRNYLRHMIVGTPQEDEGMKWPAFLGSAVGDRLEAALVDNDPTWTTQREVAAMFPSWRTTPGHVDAYNSTLDILIDFKAKDGLTVVERAEVDRAHLYQLVGYYLGLVQAGELTKDARCYLVYVDRSGANPDPVVKEVEVTPELIAEVDAWVEDAVYAARNNEEAPRDRPYHWCEVACPFFAECRGQDEHQSGGLIEDPFQVTAAETYMEGMALERRGKQLKDDAKVVLNGVNGSTGTIVVSSSWINESSIPASVRRGYNRITVRPAKS